jgi:hypothetical protein
LPGVGWGRCRILARISDSFGFARCIGGDVIGLAQEKQVPHRAFGPVRNDKILDGGGRLFVVRFSRCFAALQ